MKVTGYKPQVQLNTINPPAVSMPRDLNAYGANQSGSNQLGRAIGQAVGFIDRELEEKMTADVMAANTEYSKRLNDTLYGENGLMLRQQNNAANITSELEDAEKKIRSEVLQNNKISYQRAGRAFNITADREYFSAMN